MQAETLSYSIQPDSFISHGMRCEAHFYKPNNVTDNLPVVIMAHGFAARMDFGLHPFADAFVKAGMAVLMFNYRGFGQSEGDTRFLVNPFMHVQDWKAALEYVKKRAEIDPTRIALWGSSFSGGHVLSVAAEHPEVRAVSAQVPFLDGIPTAMQASPIDMIKSSLAGLWDVFRSVTAQSPYYIAVVGKPGSNACMKKIDSEEGFRNLIPSDENEKWQNYCPARIALLLPFYRPVLKLNKIQSPCLLVNATQDNLFSPRTIYKAAKKIRNVKLIHLDCGHFDPYKGKWFDEALQVELDFFKEKLIS